MSRRIYNVDSDSERSNLVESNIRLKLIDNKENKNYNISNNKNRSESKFLYNVDIIKKTEKTKNLRIKTNIRSNSVENEKPSSVHPDADQIRLKDALNLTYSKSARLILEAAGDRAIRRDGDAVASIGLMIILQATVAVGLDMPAGVLSTPRWLVDFALAQGVSPEKIASYGSTARVASPRSEIVLRQAASTAIRMAVALARATVGRPRFDARHLIIAVLDSPDRAVAEQMRKDSEAAGLNLHALRDELIRRTIDTPEPGERVEIWQQLLDARSATWAQIDPIASAAVLRTSTVSGFASDRAATSKEDPLGIDADVTAFARLICLEQATPPLSIGIFGEWGSGKSSFMERLQLRVAELTDETRKTAAESKEAKPATNGALPGQGDSNFIQNVVQIRFNAWHYADANLWASLTAEFFDQLRRGGYEGQRSSIYLALIDKVALHVRSLEASAQKAGDRLTSAERDVRQADEALASARKKLVVSDLALASEQLSNQFDKIRTDKNNRAKLQEVGRRLYRDDLADEIDGFAATVSEAAGWPGKLALIGKVIIGGGRERWLAITAIVLVAFAGIGWPIADVTSAAVAGGRLLAWGGAAFAGFQALAGALKLAKPVLDGAWAYAKAVEKARKELAKDVEDKEVAARDAARALAEAQETAKKAKAPLDQYAAAAAGTPSTVLRYFLFEDNDVRDYDKQIGLVSRARRSFEQLDAIFTAKRDGPAAKKKQASLKSGETLDSKELVALQRYETMQLEKNGFAIPERIVLYIDDLDRCTHQQVYDVLQAIHLLLAFELFVVVVGVDVRWVEEAVARQFVISAELPADGRQRDAGPKDITTERRKRAIEYLEKIFQLPFWLRRLSTEGDKGGSYGKYVQELLQANLTTVQQSPFQQANKAADQHGRTRTEENIPGADDAARGDALGATRGADDPSAVDVALATVQLTQAEVDFLASPEIGAIAFKSPRSVKRMLNVYRIVRARMSETELDEFLGRNGKRASWPIAAFFAAVETGQSVEIADLLYDGLKAAPSHEIFTAISLEAIVGKDKQSAMHWIAHADQLSSGDLSGGIYALNTRRGHPEMNAHWVKCGEALAVARIVRRYSFNRYH